MRRGTVPSWSRHAAECVFKSELSIEPALEVGAVDGHFQLVPLGAIQHELLRAIAEFHRTADAVVEFPERHVVLGIVVTNREPVAVRLDVEQNA